MKNSLNTQNTFMNQARNFEMTRFLQMRNAANEIEGELIRRLTTLNIKARLNPSEDLAGKQTCDVIIDYCPYAWMYNTGDTIEVKCDQQWMYTGNVAVEWEAMKHSNAHFVSYFLDDCFYEQPRGSLMWALYENHKTKKWKEVKAGDWLCWNTLIPVSAFIAPCKTLTRLPVKDAPRQKN